MALTKSQVSQIRSDLNAAMLAVATKHGIDFNLGNIRFSEDSFSGKLSAVVRGAGGTNTTTPTDPKALALMKTGIKYLPSTFSPSASYFSKTLGKVKIIGYNNRAPAYPFVVVTEAGKRFKVSLNSAIEIVKS